VAYADLNPTCRELALLAINSYQRDLSDANQLVRAMALRVLCSIRERAIVQIQLMSLKKCASDSSSYVKKTAAQNAGKVFQIDNEAKPEVVEVIERLLADKNTQVLSSAMSAFNEVCPDELELLHPHFRKLCHLLADLDEWGQILTLNILTRYARRFFAKPSADAVAAPGAVAAAEKKVRRRRGRQRARACALRRDLRSAACLWRRRRRRALCSCAARGSRRWRRHLRACSRASSPSSLPFPPPPSAAEEEGGLLRRRRRR
jgi:hypothetical protein